MSGKFTPGPWYIHKLGKHWNNTELEHIEICYGKDDECICDTVYQDSDARLIAAAPDMYEALKAVLADVQSMIEDGYIGDVMNNMLYVHARAALAKAEGTP